MAGGLGEWSLETARRRGEEAARLYDQILLRIQGVLACSKPQEVQEKVEMFRIRELPMMLNLVRSIKSEALGLRSVAGRIERDDRIEK